LKNKSKTKIFILTLELIFAFLIINLIFQGTNILFNEKYDKDNRNILIYLTDSDSHEYEWYRTWGGGLSDSGGSVAVDSSDNVYISGGTESLGVGGADMVFVKYDSSGVYQWNRTWGGVNYDISLDVAVDSTNNIYLVGITESLGAGGQDLCLVKYDNSGVYQWNRTWGGTDDDDGNGIAVDSSDNVYITGYTESFGFDMVLVKYNSSGVQQWNSTWGGIGGGRGTGVVLDSSGNIYVVGYTSSFGAGSYDMVLVKFDSFGVQEWNRTWGGSSIERGYGVAVDSLDNVYVSGRTYSFGVGDFDMALVKYDSFGVQQWNRTWGGISTDYGNRIAVDSSDNVYFSGTTVGFGPGYFDMTLVKYNAFGEQQWNSTWGGGSNDFGSGVALDSSENIYFGGTTASYGAGIDDIALVKYSKIPEVKIVSPNQNEFFGSVAPNFNISIVEPFLHTTWYSLDGGTTNIIFSGLTGTVNQTEWDKKGDGTVTISFYGNNTLGNEGYAEVTVRKDTIAPTSLISYIVHKEPNIVNKSTTFTLTADDGSASGVSVIRYKINESNWFEYSTPFDLAQSTYGDILISYQAIDEVGNIEVINTVLVALVEIHEKPAEEFPFIIIIAIVSTAGGIGAAIITIGILRKRKPTKEVI